MKEERQQTVSGSKVFHANGTSAKACPEAGVGRAHLWKGLETPARLGPSKQGSERKDEAGVGGGGQSRLGLVDHGHDLGFDSSELGTTGTF